jgi:pyruvate formate lyase activating enzyme
MKLLPEQNTQEYSAEPAQLTGLIEKIERFRVHDGPGIRSAVFFMGCPLRCHWCSNPETWEIRRRLVLRAEHCSGCASCLEYCPVGALDLVNGKASIDRERCISCGLCAEACSWEALSTIGRECTVDELSEELLRDSSFYESSAGGVTLTGGEPMLQIDFVESLCRVIREHFVSIALDTSGYFPFASLPRIAKYLDCVLYDLKMCDPAMHLYYTGQGNSLIIENLRRTDQLSIPIIARLIMIEGITDTEEEINGKLELLLSLRNLERVDLLPYHRLGVEKYRILGLEMEQFAQFVPPKAEIMEKIRQRVEEAGLRCTIEGN